MDAVGLFVAFVVAFVVDVDVDVVVVTVLDDFFEEGRNQGGSMIILDFFFFTFL